MHTLENLKDISTSFGWEHVVQAQLGPLPKGYSEAETTSVYQRLLERARGLPGVRSASLSLTSFHTGGGSICCLAIPGYVPASDDDLTVSQNLVTPRYFETMGIPCCAAATFGHRKSSFTRPWR